jgi:Ser/Thr protein kinase RdoA (MazF antagonist)
MEDEQKDFIRVAAEKITGHFKIGHVIEITPIKPNFRNQSFCLHTDQGSFLLRLHQKTKTANDIWLEEQIIQHAEYHGITVPKLLGTFSYEERRISVQEWISGETLSSLTLTPKLAYQSGLLLGIIHKALADFDPLGISGSYDHKPIEDRLAEQIASGGEKVAIIFKLLSRIEGADKYYNTIKKFLDLSAQLQQHAWKPTHADLARPQYLHGDFNPRNIILAESNWVVLDWEDSFFGSPTFDLAKALLYLCGFPENDIHQGISQSFLSGYKALINFSQDDLTRILWEARFVIALDLNWLLVSLYYQDFRRLSFLYLDCDRIERLLELENTSWFSSKHVQSFYEKL